MSEESSEHFRKFAATISSRLERYQDWPEEKLVGLQKKQLERLAELEDSFRVALIEDPVGQEVYEDFIAHIRDVRKNILMARPFFRERQDAFSESISLALEKRDWLAVAQYHINYEFVSRSMRGKVELPPKIRKIARKIEESRRELVEMNLPLVISRAKMFYSRTPKSHLSFMDLVQIGTLGLIAAIDKFVLPYSPVFCSVAIGRMLGNFIEWYSNTALHFYPSDRRKLYRANKVLSKNPHGVLDFEELAEAVNRRDEGDAPRKGTTPDEIADLIAAATTVSADVRVKGEPDAPSNVARYEAPDEARPDVQFESTEALHKMQAAIRELPLIDRKLLYLKGLDVDLES